MTTKKRKYPKSFYDEGLGDFLEWIDDEVLTQADSKSISNKKKKSKISTKESRSNEDQIKKKNSKLDKSNKNLYGDNDVSDIKFKPSRSVKFNLLDDEEDAENNRSNKSDKRLEDKVRGLVNRLAAQTMPFVTSEFQKLYSTNSRTELNDIIYKSIEVSLLDKNSVAKRKLVAELMLLVSYLSSVINKDIVASLVHRLIRKFEIMYSSSDYSDEDKTMDNILFCIVNLYVIGSISANIVFATGKRICESKNFGPKSIELLLLIVKSVGFHLRKDNPALMKQLITMATDSSKNLQKTSALSSRIEFMLESLAAVKNNNMSKLGNYGCDIDRETIESTLKSLIRRTRIGECLSDASYDEVVRSQNWYLLETRLDEEETDNVEKNKLDAKQLDMSSKIDTRICKALGLKRPAEKTILSALLRSSDYIEASNLIIGFGLNHCSDAMVVCIQVAIHEKKYNPFHFDLINNLCKFNRRYKMATKFATMDKIRILATMNKTRVDVFKQLTMNLIKSDALPITTLKAIEWANLSDSTKEYLVFLLKTISNLPDDENRLIMSKVDKKSSFAGAMRTFTSCFLKGCKLFQ